jgi:PAS domain S-box-containing protein
MHSLLRRQLKQHLIDYGVLPDNVKGLMDVVDEAYRQFDEDRGMLERAFELSSEELLQANQELSNHREQLERLVNMRTRELKKANSRLVSEVAERKKLEERLANLNECIIGFDEDHGRNIRHLIELCGTSLNADLAFYNQIVNNRIEPIYSWNSDGAVADCRQHLDYDCCLTFVKNSTVGICTNTIRRPVQEDADSNEVSYRFDPCMGIPVSLSNGQKLGSLCVVYRDYRKVGEGDKKFFSLLTSALGSEEEREWVANALRESEEKFRSISMSAQDAIVMTDVAGNISYWNPAAERIFGYGREEMLGKPVQTFIASPAFYVAFADAFMEWRATGQGRPEGRIVELEAKRKDGSMIAIELSLSSVMLGNSLHAIGIVRDVSERKRAEAELRESEKRLRIAKDAAETANRAKSQFLANMSHEIRTPMNGVLGMLELLRGTELTPKQSRFAETIQRSGEALLDLINDILDFSKIEAGKMELKSVNFSLGKAVAEVLDMLFERAQRKKLNLSVRTVGNVPDLLIGDPMRLQQVLMNLTSNAVKFTDKGHVSITVSCTEQDAASALLLLEVEDTGIGVPAEAQSTIFNSFSQADGSPTRRYGGSGLGLAIARQLSELMGGQIGVKSELGKGSVFWFTVKLLKQPDAESNVSTSVSPAEETDVMEHNRLSLRVLLVEDNPVNQEVARAMLETIGCRVNVAGDGEQAVAAVTEGSHDIVLMDCQMPKMDGYEATQLIREWEASKTAAGKESGRLPIIALTAHAMKGDRERCIEAGMDGYLSKPYRINMLCEVLGEHVPLKRICKRSLVRSADDNRGVPSEPPFLVPDNTYDNAFSLPIDHSVLDNLRGLQIEGAPDVVASIINIYLANSPFLLNEVKRSAETGDSETLRRASHTLKSSSANVGAMKLSESCRELEGVARANFLGKDDGEKIVSLIAAIEDEFARVRHALQADLDYDTTKNVKM